MTILMAALTIALQGVQIVAYVALACFLGELVAQRRRQTRERDAIDAVLATEEYFAAQRRARPDVVVTSLTKFAHFELLMRGGRRRYRHLSRAELLALSQACAPKVGLGTFGASHA